MSQGFKGVRGANPPSLSDLPLDARRSIMAAAGYPVASIGDPECCVGCGRKMPSLEPGEDGRVSLDAEFADRDSRKCGWCRIREFRTDSSATVWGQLNYDRRGWFDKAWKMMQRGWDGAAWHHPILKLSVIESVALYPSKAGESVVEAAGRLGRVVEVKREYGSAFEVQSVNRAMVLTVKRTREEAEAFLRGYLSGKGWSMWHHISVAVSGAPRLPDYREMARVREDFIGEHRECYQVFPPKSRYVNLHPRVLHFWSCLEPDAPEGAVLPCFEGDLAGTLSI